MSTNIVPGVSPENASIAVLDGQPVVNRYLNKAVAA